MNTQDPQPLDDQHLWDRCLAGAWSSRKTVFAASREFRELTGRYPTGLRRAPITFMQKALSASRYLALYYPKTSKRLLDAIPVSGKFHFDVDGLARFFAAMNEPMAPDTAVKAEQRQAWAERDPLTRQMHADEIAIRAHPNTPFRRTTNWMQTKATGRGAKHYRQG